MRSTGKSLRSDAQSFYCRICRAVPCHVVSVAVLSEHFEILAEEWKSSSCKATYGEAEIGQWIGSDILGWDIVCFMLLTKTAAGSGLIEKVQEQTGLAFHVGF